MERHVAAKQSISYAGLMGRSGTAVAAVAAGAVALTAFAAWRWKTGSEVSPSYVSQHRAQPKSKDKPRSEEPQQEAGVADGSHKATSRGPKGAITGRLPDRALGMGLAPIKDWSTEYPFLDLVKSARRWRSKVPLELDEQGWPKTLPPGLSAELYFLTLPEGTRPPWTKLVVRYEGEGKLSYKLGARHEAKASKPGRDIVTLDTTKRYAVLSLDQTNPQKPVRNIRILPLEHEAAFEEGAIFNPQWLGRMKPFRALRFMDWMDTNNSTISTWEQRPKTTDASWSENYHQEKTTHGVPAEVMVALANELKSDAWFNMPHLADDNYVRQFAKLVKSTLSSPLHVFVEHSNEVWNWQFRQAQHANRTGRALWGDHGNAYMQWHGMRTARVCELWKAEFGAQSDRVHCVLGLQAHYEALAAPALDCPLWTKSEKTKPCFQHGIDAIAIAGYFSGCLNGKGAGNSDQSETVRKWAQAGEEGLKQAVEQAGDSRHFACDNSVEALAKVFTRFRDIAKERGLDLVAYEGGQHITGAGGPMAKDQSIVAFHLAVNRRAEMKELYERLLNVWKRSGGGLFVHYLDIAAPSQHGSWGALEYSTQADAPKWQALDAFTRQGCWWPGC